MKEIVLQIPTLENEQNIEIDVKINGRKKVIKYHVEILAHSKIEDADGDKIKVIKQVINERSDDWELIQIGAPTGKNNIPIMFRKKEEEEKDKKDKDNG